MRPGVTIRWPLSCPDCGAGWPAGRCALFGPGSTRPRTPARDLAAAAKEIAGTLDRLDADIAEAEQSLAARGHEDVSETLIATESLRERARGLVALCRERARSIERQRQSFLAADTITALRDELSRVDAALEEAVRSSEELPPRLAAVHADEAALAEERRLAEATWADLTPDSRLGEVRGELTALQSAMERVQSDLARQRERRDTLAARRNAVAEEVERQRSALEEITRGEPSLVEAVDAAEAAHAVAAAEFTMAEARLRTLEKESSLASARSEAIELALAEHRPSTDLSAFEGISGRLGDLLEIDPGWEAAVEAAAGPALWAWVADGPEAASGRARCLRRIRHSGVGPARTRRGVGSAAHSRGR